jgi:hypothetical protein
MLSIFQILVRNKGNSHIARSHIEKTHAYPQKENGKPSITHLQNTIGQRSFQHMSME